MCGSILIGGSCVYSSAVSDWNKGVVVNVELLYESCACGTGSGLPESKLLQIIPKAHIWPKGLKFVNVAMRLDCTDIMRTFIHRNGSIHHNKKTLKTRKLCYRKDDRAMRPTYECPEIFGTP